MPVNAMESLQNFCQLTASAPADVSSFLMEAIAKHGTIDAAIFFQIDDNAEPRMTASRGVPESVLKLRIEGASLGHELVDALIGASHGEFDHAMMFPFIDDGKLFGALVALLRPSTILPESQSELVQTLVQLTAATLSKAHQHQKLVMAHENLEKSQGILARSEKLRALGQMSAGMVHDLKNLLSPLLMGVALLDKVLDQPDQVKKVTNMLRCSIRRAVDTTERLRNFSRQSPEQADVEIVDINSLLKETIEFTRSRLSGIQLKQELGTPPNVQAASSDFVSALVNLIFNAVDAMKGKGTLFIRSGESSGGGFVQIEDTGPGIPAEIRNRIFEPFFTTKGEQGTGLGLPAVYAFVLRHGGSISVDSEPGAGAKFTIWFPAAV